MRIRLVNPSLKYFNSFLRYQNKATPLSVTPLKYLAEAREQEYWLVDDERYLGRVHIRRKLAGRKLDITDHIDLNIDWDQSHMEPRAIKLAVRKAAQLGIDPIYITCPATHWFRREVIEREGGKFVETVRVRTTEFRGKLRVYAFSMALAEPTYTV
jgi:predicted acetyltransferase